MEYIVQITELLSHRITIEADSAEEAKQYGLIDAVLERR